MIARRDVPRGPAASFGDPRGGSSILSRIRRPPGHQRSSIRGTAQPQATSLAIASGTKRPRIEESQQGVAEQEHGAVGGTEAEARPDREEAEDGGEREGGAHHGESLEADAGNREKRARAARPESDRSGRPIPSRDTAASVAAVQATNTADRHKRMFGALLGHLSKAKQVLERDQSVIQQQTTMIQQVSARQERMKEEIYRQREEAIEKEVAERVALTLESEMKFLDSAAGVWRTHAARLSGWLVTDTQPPIYWMPAKHNRNTLSLLEQQQAAHTASVVALEEEISRSREEAEGALKARVRAGIRRRMTLRQDDVGDGRHDVRRSGPLAWQARGADRAAERVEVAGRSRSSSVDRGAGATAGEAGGVRGVDAARNEDEGDEESDGGERRQAIDSEDDEPHEEQGGAFVPPEPRPASPHDGDHDAASISSRSE